MKCPLCDGTVVNGRCKECGMPYRNDEILYHLITIDMHQIRPVRSCRHRESDPWGKEAPERLLAIGIHPLAEKKSGLQKLRSIQNLGYFG